MGQGSVWNVNPVSVPIVSLPRRFEKVLLVCADTCQEVEEHLSAAGCVVKRVRDGKRALHRVRRESFHAAVLVSTGKEMDLVETVLNLSDIRTSMEIAIIANAAEASESLIQKITAVVPNVITVNVQELDLLFEAFGQKRKQRSKSRIQQLRAHAISSKEETKE